MTDPATIIEAAALALRDDENMYEPPLELVVAMLAVVTPLILANERKEIAEQARRYAGHYQEGSDGRNTFIMLAEWIEARARTDDLDRHTLMGPPGDFNEL